MRRQITKWGFISGRRPSRKCLAFHLVSILLLLGAQTSAGQDVDSLFQRARAGNKAALHELAKRPSAEVSKLFDELAAIYGNDADFQMEFCTVKASSGDLACVMRIASQVLWADPAEQVRAAESVPRLEKAMALRIFRKLLDEQYTPPPDFDLSFLSPARFSLMTLPSLVADPPAPDFGVPFPAARQAWLRYFQANASLTKVSLDWNIALASAAAGNDPLGVLTVAWLAPTESRAAAATALPKATGGVQIALWALLYLAGDPSMGPRLREVRSWKGNEETVARAFYLIREPATDSALCQLSSNPAKRAEGTPAAQSLAIRFLAQLHPEIFVEVPDDAKRKRTVQSWCGARLKTPAAAKGTAK